MSVLLRLAPWYRPAEIARRERRTAAVRRYSIATRLRAEAVVAQQRIGR